MDSAYCFKCDAADGTASFSVKRPGLEFDVKKFDEALFEGADKYEGLEFPDIDEGWSKEAKYVFGVVKSIAEEICSKIEPLAESGDDASDDDLASIIE